MALITGGASGIGESTARLFSRHGAKVVIADIQDGLGQSVCEELSPTSTSFVHCDVTSEKDVENAVNVAVAKHGKLDIMFNNAGIIGEAEPNILHNHKAEFQKILNVNVVGAFLGTKHAARVMIPGIISKNVGVFFFLRPFAFYIQSQPVCFLTFSELIIEFINL